MLVKARELRGVLAALRQLLVVQEGVRAQVVLLVARARVYEVLAEDQDVS